MFFFGLLSDLNQRQGASLAAQREEFYDYQGALSASSTIMQRGHRGAIELTQRKGRWFAVIDGESRIPKVKKGAA